MYKYVYVYILPSFVFPLSANDEPTTRCYGADCSICSTPERMNRYDLHFSSICHNLNHCRITPLLATCIMYACQAYNWPTLIKGLISLLRRSSSSSSHVTRSSDDSRTDDSRYFLVLQKQKYSSTQLLSLVSDCEIEVVGMQQNQENQSMSDQNTETIVLRFSNTQ